MDSRYWLVLGAGEWKSHLLQYPKNFVLLSRSIRSKVEQAGFELSCDLHTLHILVHFLLNNASAVYSSYTN